MSESETRCNEITGGYCYIMEILELRWLCLSTSAGTPPFGDLVRNVSAALSDPGAGGTLDGLYHRRVPHDMLDFFARVSVKLKRRDRVGKLTAFDH